MAELSVSKAAVIGLTKAVAADFMKQGIRANAICPGSITGPRMDHVIELESQASGRSVDDIRAGFAAQVSMRTFIDPEEIAKEFCGHPEAGQAVNRLVRGDGCRVFDEDGRAYLDLLGGIELPEAEAGAEEPPQGDVDLLLGDRAGGEIADIHVAAPGAGVRSRPRPSRRAGFPSHPVPPHSRTDRETTR